MTQAINVEKEIEKDIQRGEVDCGKLSRDKHQKLIVAVSQKLTKIALKR